MLDNTLTTDRVEESKDTQSHDNAMPSLEDQQQYTKDQGNGGRDYKRVFTGEHQEPFSIVDDAVAAENTAKGGFGPGKDIGDDDDGEVSRADDGGVIVEYKDGTISHTKDGETVTVNPDGVTLLSRKDGTQIQTDPDGAVTTTSPDGKLIERVEADRKTVTVVDTENGNVVHKDADGNITKSTKREDGLIETDLPNGDKKFSSTDPKDQWEITKHKDGTTTFESPKTGRRDYDKNGDVTVTKTDDEGNTVVESPNGNRDTFKKDGTKIFEHENGKSTFYPSGVVVDELKGGTKITQGNDHSKLTEYPDGRRVYQDPSGKVRELDDDEEIAYKYR